MWLFTTLKLTNEEGIQCRMEIKDVTVTNCHTCIIRMLVTYNGLTSGYQAETSIKYSLILITDLAYNPLKLCSEGRNILNKTVHCNPIETNDTKYNYLCKNSWKNSLLESKKITHTETISKHLTTSRY